MLCFLQSAHYVLIPLSLSLSPLRFSRSALPRSLRWFFAQAAPTSLSSSTPTRLRSSFSFELPRKAYFPSTPLARLSSPALSQSLSTRATTLSSLSPKPSRTRHRISPPSVLLSLWVARMGNQARKRDVTPKAAVPIDGVGFTSPIFEKKIIPFGVMFSASYSTLLFWGISTQDMV